MIIFYNKLHDGVIIVETNEWCRNIYVLFGVLRKVTARCMMI